MRVFVTCLVLVSQLTPVAISQQAASTAKRAEAVCTFADGKQIKVEYNSPPAKREEDFHEGKLWEPGGSPMFLFTSTPLTLGSSVIPDGAYSLYVIPAKQNWTLVVNRNVTAGSKYDGKQDLVRVPMPLGETNETSKQPRVAFAQVGPKQCNLRLYYEKVGTWAEFRER
jgi:Protein of unknown function (DUF2911)